MRIRKCLALGGAILIFLGCLLVYRLTDYTLYLQEEAVQSEPFKNRAKEKSRNSLTGGEILSHNNIALDFKHFSDCENFQPKAHSDIQMSEVYKKIKFDNIDGGVWKQGWDIKVNNSRWSEKKKLKVFVVPHSHNDPGWLKTFEDYYFSESRNILSHMLKQLENDPKKKFIWAEISFFSLWWDELSKADQDKVRRLIIEKQLEIVTGGWVMNDEANTHYYSMITQLTEGHQWMKSNVQSVPKSGWTIDPFGESPVMAYLLKKTGIKNLVIHRVHYSVKKYFAQLKHLEFRWRQFWDKKGSNDILTHMTPFYSYDIPHTCGPDPKICCQFDFKRLPGNALSCPWKEPPKPINGNNVARRAEMLLDQYRKKAELYRTDTLLVPLGDDFRYQTQSEWHYQFENYFKIFKYVNSNPDLHAEVAFSTLSEFFEALREELSFEDFPSLIGDFFTYADRDDHYWSGYYTSRPFYKRMDRILMGYHRAAEIIFSLGWGIGNLGPSSWLLKPQIGFAGMLRDIRRSLSLFQHHDGITGTARDHVMEDYARKMVNAINDAKHIIQQVTHYLLWPSKLGPYPFNPDEVYFDFDDQKKNYADFSQRRVVSLSEGESKTLVFYNSLTYKRQELVSFLVSSPFMQVLDQQRNVIPCQISPFFIQDEVMDENRYEVFFIAEVPPIGLTSYKIIKVTSNEKLKGKNSLSSVKIYNSLKTIKPSMGFEQAESGIGKEFLIDNKIVTVAIRENGLLKSVTLKDPTEFVPLQLDFICYEARKKEETSGAYLFLPEGEAITINKDYPLVRVHEGPLFTRVESKLDNVHHFLTVHHTPQLAALGIEIVNVVDISKKSNYELAMRLSSSVKSGDDFYSDLNGFQVVKRTRFDKIPIQGNFYPMPTVAYIEDEKLRINILSGQPLGVSSLKEGELEVLQDRRLKQDDNRGLGQGVLDNKVTPNVFRILVERRKENCIDSSASLSANAYQSLNNLLNPIQKMISVSESRSQIYGSYTPVTSGSSLDIHLVAVRTFDEEETSPRAGLLFHRPLLSFCFLKSLIPGDGSVNIHSLFPNHFGNNMKKSSLSFLKNGDELDKRKNQRICPMDFLPLVLS